MLKLQQSWRYLDLNTRSRITKTGSKNQIQPQISAWCCQHFYFGGKKTAKNVFLMKSFLPVNGAQLMCQKQHFHFSLFYCSNVPYSICNLIIITTDRSWLKIIIMQCFDIIFMETVALVEIFLLLLTLKAQSNIKNSFT